MKKLFTLTPFLVLALVLFTACEDRTNDCPANMHEQTLQDGTTICVPD